MRFLSLTVSVGLVVADLATLHYDPNSFSWVEDIWLLLCLLGLVVLTIAGPSDDMCTITFDVQRDEVGHTVAKHMNTNPIKKVSVLCYGAG